MGTKHNKKRPIRCAIYARDATEENNVSDFSSIQNQVASCKALIQSHKDDGWILVAQETDVASGRTLDRPGLQRLLAKAVAKEFDQIVTYKIDRLSRSIFDFHDLWCRFEQLGIDLACSNQSMNTSDGTGRLMLNILLSFASFEREIKAQQQAKGETKNAHRINRIQETGEVSGS